MIMKPLRNVELVTATVSNWEDYDTVLIGYPIWWGIAAWPVNEFVLSNDFTGKTVIPFCTSQAPDLARAVSCWQRWLAGGNWLEGHRFSERPSQSDIQSWLNSLEIFGE